MEAKGFSVEVDKFKEHIKTIEPEVREKIQKFHLDILPFLYYKKYIHFAVVAVTLTTFAPFIETIFHLTPVLEILFYVISVYLMMPCAVKQIVQLEGIVLEKLNPTMLAE